MQEVAEAVSVFSKSGRGFVNLSAVDWLEAAAGGVGEHFLGEAAGEIGLAFQEHLLEGDDVRQLIAVWQFGGSVDFGASVGAVVGAPAAYGVKIFEGKSHRVNLAVATCASLVFAVQLELFADGLGATQIGRERLDIGRRR